MVTSYLWKHGGEGRVKQSQAWGCYRTPAYHSGKSLLGLTVESRVLNHGSDEDEKMTLDMRDLSLFFLALLLVEY